MTVRPLNAGDLCVLKGLQDSVGRQRVHVSLKGAAWCNAQFWLTEAAQRDPRTLERIKGRLRQKLERQLRGVEGYRA